MPETAKKRRNLKRLARVYEAAKALSIHYDWNTGHSALQSRRKLLKALNAIEPVPDFETKVPPRQHRSRRRVQKKSSGSKAGT
jgi:hypothetical protein